VDEFIAGLPPRHQAAIDDQISRVNALLTVARPHLPFPYSSQVDGELRELRCHYGSTLYRILYRRSRQLVVLLHIFNKRTRTVPGEDTEIARARWVDFERRMNAVPRAPPRAAGHDAPPPSRG
jgi:phage-related protein